MTNLSESSFPDAATHPCPPVGTILTPVTELFVDDEGKVRLLLELIDVDVELILELLIKLPAEEDDFKLGILAGGGTRRPAPTFPTVCRPCLCTTTI